MPRQDSLISVEKRILLHLLNFRNIKSKSNIPFESTQNGIAQSVGANRNYIPRLLKKFVADGFVKESYGRMKKAKKRQKFYSLTDSGKKYARELKDEYSDMQISLILPDSTTKKLKLKNIISYLKKENIHEDITLQDIYNDMSRDRTIDIKTILGIKKKKYFDFSSEAPEIIHFFGRKKEMSQIKKWLEDKEKHNIIYIHGMAGIGKTTLAAKLIEDYRQSRHLFWHNFNELDTLRGVLLKIAEFLSKLGHDHLELYLRARIDLDYYEVSRILGKSIGKIEAVLVFDDFQKSKEKIRKFFVYFLRMLVSSAKTKILIASREIVPFYDTRDVKSRKIVAELGLEGLDFESSKKLLKEKGIDKKKYHKIYGLTAGNPLFLEILESKNDLERYMHDELFSKLGEDERKILGIISIYRFPVPEESLVVNRDFDFEKLYILTQKSIVKKDAQNRYFVHDIIKRFFYNRLSLSARKKYHLHAAQWYEDSEYPIDLIEAIYHYQESGESKNAANFAINNCTSILDGGNASELLVTLETLDEKRIDTKLLAQILMVKGKAYNICGEWKKALLCYTQATDHTSVIRDNKLKMKAICESGHILEEQNEFERAMECFTRSLKMSNKEKDSSAIGECYRGIGRLHWRNSRHEEAIIHYTKCLKIAKKTGDLDLMASTYIDLGNVYDEMYEIDEAIDCYKRSLDILKKVKNMYETARAYGNLGITYRHSEKFDKAIEYTIKELALAQELSEIKLIGYGSAAISYCYAKIGEFKTAKDYAKKAEDISLKIGNKNIMYMVNRTYAIAQKHEIHWDEAVKYLQKCIEINENTNALYALSDSHFELGLLYKEMEDSRNALKHIKIAVGLFNKLGIVKAKHIMERLSEYDIDINMI